MISNPFDDIDMYSPLQIEIIKLLGSKKLSEGCLIQQWEYLMKLWCIYEGICNMKEIDSANCMQKKESDLGEILWHFPTLEDLFIKAEEKGWEYELLANPEWCELFIYWTWVKLFHTKYNPKLKPYQQTEETMQEILNLFK